MTQFIFAHGAYHSGWHFNRLIAELEQLGQVGSAPDLPCDRSDSTAASYADLLALTAEQFGEPAVLVGHSLGGLCIPLVPERTPLVSRIVFLAALIPSFGESLDDQGSADPTLFADFKPTASPTGNTDGSATATPEWAREVFYHDVDPHLAEQAIAHLRPQFWTHAQERFVLNAWPALPMSSIVCTGDRAVNPDWSRRVARNRLGIDPIDFPSGHSPFLSHPEALARLLVEIAEASP
jgi:pimeloyl-ACP methyl ester carboxylesterase